VKEPYTVLDAIREIEAESGAADSILQPGAAFALGCLGLAVDCGPGWTAEDVAAALTGERP
jgi:hypothetical protein